MTHPDMLPHRPPGGPERDAAERLDRVLFGPRGTDPCEDIARTLRWLGVAALVLAATAGAVLVFSIAALL